MIPSVTDTPPPAERASPQSSPGTSLQDQRLSRTAKTSLRPDVGTRPALGYIPELDGLRGTAVVLVVAFHAMIPGLSGGYIGVDIFFVLSGYLITSTIVREVETTGSFDLLSFFARRAIRLWPALIATCVMFWGYAVFFVAPERHPHWDVIASVAYIANWTRAFKVDAPHFLGHTWSLAVEEQFYLLWPLLLWPALRYGGKRFAGGLALTIAVASALWRTGLFWDGAPGYRLYNALDTRSDGLLLGCALALFLSARHGVKAYYPIRIPMLLPLAGGLGLASIVALLPWNAPSMLTVGYLAAAVCSGLIIATAVSSDTMFLKIVLTNRILVWLGQISYSLYIVHYPVTVVVREAPSVGAFGVSAISLVVSFALALFSYTLVERPALQLRHNMESKQLRAFGAVGLLLTLSVMVAGSLFFWA